jgi:hypothetical protein
LTKRFDATPKGLIEIRPRDWPAFLGVDARAVEVVDADVSTVSAATDKVLLVRADDGHRIQHLDFQSGPDASLPRRIHVYSALLEEYHHLPVESVVLLLRPEANLRALNGAYQMRLPGARRPYVDFQYRVTEAGARHPDFFAGILYHPFRMPRSVKEKQTDTDASGAGCNFLHGAQLILRFITGNLLCLPMPCNRSILRRPI